MAIDKCYWCKSEWHSTYDCPSMKLPPMQITKTPPFKSSFSLFSTPKPCPLCGDSMPHNDFNPCSVLEQRQKEEKQRQKEESEKRWAWLSSDDEAEGKKEAPKDNPTVLYSQNQSSGIDDIIDGAFSLAAAAVVGSVVLLHAGVKFALDKVHGDSPENGKYATTLLASAFVGAAIGYGYPIVQKHVLESKYPAFSIYIKAGKEDMSLSGRIFIKSNKDYEVAKSEAYERCTASLSLFEKNTCREVITVNAGKKTCVIYGYKNWSPVTAKILEGGAYIDHTEMCRQLGTLEYLCRTDYQYQTCNYY